MAIYTTANSLNLPTQIMLINKNSNVDYDYGPYESTKTLEEIKNIIGATLQVGKTIGIVGTDGKVTEYWAQPNDSGVLEFVQKQAEVDVIPDASIEALE